VDGGWWIVDGGWWMGSVGVERSKAFEPYMGFDLGVVPARAPQKQQRPFLNRLIGVSLGFIQDDRWTGAR